MSFHHKKTDNWVLHLEAVIGKLAVFFLVMSFVALPVAPVFASEEEVILDDAVVVTEEILDIEETEEELEADDVEEDVLNTEVVEDEDVVQEEILDEDEAEGDAEVTLVATSTEDISEEEGIGLFFEASTFVTL